MSVADPQHREIVGALNLFEDHRVRLGETEAMAELRDDLLRASYQPGDVHLDSGVEQPYFFDKYLIVARPAILRRLSRFMAARVPAEVDRVAAPTLGAVAIGTAVSLETGLPLAIARTHWEESRRKQPVEGGMHRGERVALIEDVVATGDRALHAVARLRDEGAKVVLVLCAVDCERGADERLADASIEYVPLFRYSALTRITENR